MPYRRLAQSVCSLTAISIYNPILKSQLFLGKLQYLLTKFGRRGMDHESLQHEAVAWTPLYSKMQFFSIQPFGDLSLQGLKRHHPFILRTSFVHPSFVLQIASIS